MGEPDVVQYQVYFMSFNLSEHPTKNNNCSKKSIFYSQENSAENKKSQQALLSIIVPVYNEQEVIAQCHQRLSAVADTLTINTEIIYINDGSSDNTLQILQGLQQQDSRIAIIDLSRNFGKEVTMTAGLDYAEGDAVIIIDADLQDPPELIPEMVAEWQRGYDMVYMKRESRKGESWLKKLTAVGFYRIMNRISDVDMPEGVGDFRLLSRRAVDSLCQLRESNRFMKGLFAWLGYKKKEIIYHRDERASGSSKWNYLELWNLAIDGITAFSTAPLKLASYAGILCLSLSMFALLWFSIQFFVLNEAVSAMKLLAMGILFLGGMQMLMLGTLGEYLGRIHTETKKRPLYYVDNWTPSVISKETKKDNQESASKRNVL